MVEAIKKIISQYQENRIKTKERLILLLAKQVSLDIAQLDNEFKMLNLDLNFVNNIIDSYLIVSHGSKIDMALKKFLENDEIIDSNPNLLQDLAKIYFYCDSISIEDNNILIRKNICLRAEPNAPKIDIDKAILTALNKIKYNKLTQLDIDKIRELEQYPEYFKLYTLLIKAIEYEIKIKNLTDDQCKITLNELEAFLN